MIALAMSVSSRTTSKQFICWQTELERAWSDSYAGKSKGIAYIFSCAEAMEGEEQLLVLLLKYFPSCTCNSFWIINCVVSPNCIDIINHTWKLHACGVGVHADLMQERQKLDEHELMHQEKYDFQVVATYERPAAAVERRVWEWWFGLWRWDSQLPILVHLGFSYLCLWLLQQAHFSRFFCHNFHSLLYLNAASFPQVFQFFWPCIISWETFSCFGGKNLIFLGTFLASNLEGHFLVLERRRVENLFFMSFCLFLNSGNLLVERY